MTMEIISKDRRKSMNKRMVAASAGVLMTATAYAQMGGGQGGQGGGMMGGNWGWGMGYGWGFGGIIIAIIIIFGIVYLSKKS
jgi:hypothetical protein